ncbi:hypothetical protein PFISCL1PPCAC_4460, partial [Pristionchus fissidentatus]
DIEDRLREYHAKLTAAESELYLRYKPTPALRGVHPLADSVLLGNAVRTAHSVGMEKSGEAEEAEGDNSEHGME